MVVGIPDEGLSRMPPTPPTPLRSRSAGRPLPRPSRWARAPPAFPSSRIPGFETSRSDSPSCCRVPTARLPRGTATQTTWNFTLTKPAGSAASLDLIDKTTRFPHFTPDVVGTYTVAETVSGKSMKIYAGRWVGILQPAVDGSDNPRGDVDPGCLIGGVGCAIRRPPWRNLPIGGRAATAKSWSRGWLRVRTTALPTAPNAIPSAARTWAPTPARGVSAMSSPPPALRMRRS